MRILLVFDPNRQDLFSYFASDKANEYYLLFSDSKGDKLHPALSFIREEFEWKDFSTPFDIINLIRPDKILFHEVFDLKQIALNIAAKHRSIPTLFIDHGIWSCFQELLTEDIRLQSTTRRNKIRKLKKLFKVIKGYIFYYSVIRGVALRNQGKFLVFPVYAFFKSLVQAVNKIDFPERRPEKFVLFAHYNLEPINSYYHCEQSQVLYSGFPYFDFLFNDLAVSEKDYLVFIDHPYLEDKILNWTPAFHSKLAETLLKIAHKSGMKLLVKLHPRSDVNIWNGYRLPEDKIQILTTATTQLYSEAKLILGYASTLLIGLISQKKNVVLIGWHPTPTIFGPDYSKYNVCHKTMDIQEAEIDYDFWIHSNLSLLNTAGYEGFLREFNFPFDGKAAERIINYVSAHEGS